MQKSSYVSVIILWRIWTFVIELIFVTLCLRIQIAAFSEIYPNYIPQILLTLGGLVTGFFYRTSPLTAVYFTPVLAGLGQAAILTIAQPLSNFLSAFYLGVIARELFATMPFVQKSEGRDDGQTRLLPTLRTVILAVLKTIIIISLVKQFLGEADTSLTLRSVLKRSFWGFGEPLYYLSESFVWLQGLCFFELLLSTQSTIARFSDSLVRLIKYTCCVFVFLQFAFNIPSPLRTDPLDPIQASAYHAPFEDISSFGSIIVSIFAFELSLAVRRRSTAFPILAELLLAVFLLILSWSRAAWLSASALAFFFSLRRLSAKRLLLFGSCFIASLTFLNVGRFHNPYLWRLASLVRFDNFATKDAGRFALYRKALSMIKARPLTGHGIGTFYTLSPKFARPSDPWGTRPDFAHNVFLQLGAELGVPAMLLFLALVCSIFIWRRSPARETDQTGLFRSFIDHLLNNPFKCALIAYIITQLTANSLNIYLTNQLFFWFLATASLSFVPFIGETDPKTSRLTIDPEEGSRRNSRPTPQTM